MLWPHQEDAVTALIEARNYALWWDVGVGKTAPLVVAGQRVGGRQLWITLASLRLQTAREVRRWRTDRPRVQVVLEGVDTVDPRADVVIVSFDHMRQPAIWRQLFSVAWDVITVDEAHRLASPGAKTTKAVYGARLDSKGALFRKAGRVWLASGTPVVNWPNELWTHFSRLWPDLTKDVVNEDGRPTYEAWCDRFCRIRKAGYGKQIVGGRDPLEVRRRLSLSGSRLRLRDTATDMPDLMVDSEAIVGDDIDFSGLDEQTSFEVRRALEGANNLGWSLESIDVLGSPVSTLRRLIAQAKAPAVGWRVVEEIEGGADRILVFGCHVDPLKEVMRTLTAAGIKAGLILGETPAPKRDALLSALKAGDIQVLVGNVLAMGTGLNMQSARRAVFLDASWSPAQNKQAIGRIHRAGQTRPCHVTFYGLAGSVDDDVTRVLARKARFIKKLED
jgi:SNF2 family DNA or RNA helicase